MGELHIGTILLMAVLTTVSAQEKLNFVDARDCPFSCTCAEYDVNCTTNVFPGSIPKEAQRFFISDSNLDFVPINAFLSNPNLLEISFIGCHIQTVRACSFAELEYLDLISFHNSHIGRIEGNAFSNLANVSILLFEDCHIGQISSFSFHNIENVGSIEFHRSTITTIHPLAFLSLTHVQEIGFISTQIRRFLRDGISRIKDSFLIYMTDVEINEWQCGIIDTAKKAGTMLTVSQSNFTCDCKLSWLWSKYPDFELFDEKFLNRCAGTGIFLNSKSPDQICTSKESRDMGCPDLLPSTPHTCSRSFDSPVDPIEKVTYPTFFERTSSSGVSMTNKIDFVVFVTSFTAVIVLKRRL
ncbi:hypothetical protein ACF0H5_018547 [Mactra antiquata]